MTGHFKVTVTVSTKDMADGVPRDSCFCPIALAIRRTFGFLNFTRVSVGISHVRVTIETTTFAAELPRKVRSLIYDYDTYDAKVRLTRLKVVAPFKLVFKALPDESPTLTGPVTKWQI